MQQYTPQDLHQLPPSPSRWVVDQLLRTNRKRVSLPCGAPHAGKSTLARQLAVAVAQGVAFLGRETVKGRVIYWQSEEDRQDAKEDFFRSGMKLDDQLIILHPDAQDDNCVELNKVLDAHSDTRLVIVETLDDFLKMPDLNDNPSTRLAFEHFDATVVSKHFQHCSFLVLHHFKKSDSQRGMSINKILGATVIAGKTDTKIYVEQVSDADTRRVIHAQIRKGASIDPTYLEFDAETQTSRLGQMVADEKAAEKKAFKFAEDIELCSRIYATTQANPGKPKWDIVKLVGGNTKEIGTRIAAMIETGEITEVPGGKKGNAKLLYLTGQEPKSAQSKEEYAGVN